MLCADGAMNVFCWYIFVIETLVLFIDNMSFSIPSGLFHTLNLKHLVLGLKREQDVKKERAL